MKTRELADYLDEILKIKEIEDKSLNGLVVDNKGEVNKIALAVDASLDAFKEAGRIGADFLFVHHGLWWGKPFPISGWTYERIRLLLDKNIALYVAHLPLDVHPELGNNVQAVGSLNWPIKGDFGEDNGLFFGKEIFFDPCRKLEEIVNDLRGKLKAKPIVWDFGPEKVKRMGYVAGGAIQFLPQVVEEGLDTYITGEPAHSYYWMAKEEKVNVIFIGHYLSETFGVKAVGKHLDDRFSLKAEFLNLPTGY